MTELIQAHQDTLRQVEPEFWVMNCSCGRRWSGYRFIVEEQYSEHLPEPESAFDPYPFTMYGFRGCPHDATGNLDCLCMDISEPEYEGITEEDLAFAAASQEQSRKDRERRDYLRQVQDIVDEEQGLEVLPF